MDSTTLKVAWNNADSAIIGNGDADDLVTVTQAGQPVAEDKPGRNTGTRRFFLDNTGDVTVTFDLKLNIGVGEQNAIRSRPQPEQATAPLQHTILRLTQHFRLIGGAASGWSYDTRGMAKGIQDVHPLLTLPNSQQSSSMVSLLIDTDFVDITEPWLYAHYRESDPPAPSPLGLPRVPDRKIWNAEAAASQTELRVLACLKGFPTLWFACVPKKCKDAAEASALVFFRPDIQYTYHVKAPSGAAGYDAKASCFNPAHVDEGGFHRVWRFLAAPGCDVLADPPEPAAGTPAMPPTPRDDRMFEHLPSRARPGSLNPGAGFARALGAADKALVLLMPFPDSAVYGHPKDLGERSAISAHLFDLSQKAVTTLHAMDAVMKTKLIRLKRFGIAGFSYGGAAMWDALKAAVVAAGAKDKRRRIANHIQEVYAFDANGWRTQRTNPGIILAAARQTGQLCLRVVVAEAGVSDVSRFTGPIEVSVRPNLIDYPHFYELRRSGNPDVSRWYHHYVKRLFDESTDQDWFVKHKPGEMTTDRGARHQFCVFGGEDSSTGITFFRQFLQLSKF